MKVAAKRSVQVRIQGRTYRIRAEGEGDGSTVQRAAAVLDETIERVRMRAGTVDSMDVAMLAALNLANSLVSERDARAEAGPKISDERVERLVALVESALVGGNAPR
jgi:cell division protein ZapA (FtsZ GTPase activity inhibitor)